ncbi:MAG: zinc-dependent metalloprotease family protein, partial [Acidobacteriota bacterium]
MRPPSLPAYVSAFAAALVLCLVVVASPAGASGEPSTLPLFSAAPPAKGAAAGDLADSVPVGVTRTRTVTLDGSAIDAAIRGSARLGIELFDGVTWTAERRSMRRNASGSVSWVGTLRSTASATVRGSVVLVTRAGVTVASIRIDGQVHMLLPEPSPPGIPAAGRSTPRRHRLHEIDESSPRFQEDPPTPIRPTPERLAAAQRLATAKAAGTVAQDDGSIQDVMVIYTEKARTDAGGQIAIENLIDLGITETNLSYETSGVDHRVQLVHTAFTDYDELSGGGDARDLIQNPNDGFMDDIPPLRDLYGADMVKLVYSGGGCGRAFIMDVVSLAHAEFAYCRTDYFCISPGYTFQHELGHIQAARHQRTALQPDSPFPFNHGFTDTLNQFRTIMAAGSSECPNGCPRRLAWSNPDVLDAETGTPMGIAETEPLPADNRKTLNATAWTVANFRLSVSPIFSDDFE